MPVTKTEILAALEAVKSPEGMPLPKTGKGRFAGRIWVEDQDFNIVRFNGSYGGGGHSNWYFNFDSWRTNVQPGVWLPTFIYSEQKDLHYALSKKLDFKGQTRLWGYNLGHAAQEQELSKILVESNVNDQTTTANDLSPIQAQRSWDRQAETIANLPRFQNVFDCESTMADCSPAQCRRSSCPPFRWTIRFVRAADERQRP